MPRARRVYEPDISHHVIHRGNNRVTMFSQDIDFELFLVFLQGAAERYAVRIHAYALMTNHYHLIATPEGPRNLPDMMKLLNGRYVCYFNRKHDRIGTLLNGRYVSKPIGDATYWLTCLRYVELNPVAARIVGRPEAYRWSSYRAHAFGDGPSWLSSHPAYDALGPSPSWRQAAYRTLCETPLTEAELALLKFAPQIIV
jgi:putative transposase